MAISTQLPPTNIYYEDLNALALKELESEANEFAATVKQILSVTKSQDPIAFSVEEFESLLEKQEAITKVISCTKNYLNAFRAQKNILLNSEARFVHIKEDHFSAESTTN